MENLHPSAGVRVLLELDESDPGGARYRASVYTPSERFDYRVSIALPGGTVEVSGPAADPKRVDLVRSLARSLARDALADDPPQWIRRVLRWRDK